MTEKLLNIKNLYDDICKFEPLILDNKDAFDGFYDYFKEKIIKKNLHKIIFKHYFPNSRKKFSDFLSEYLYQLIMDYLHDNVLSDNDTDIEE